MAGLPEFSISEALSALDRGALRRLRSVLQDDAADQRDRILRDLMSVPPSMGAELLGQLVAICDADRAARFEVLRGIRDALGDAP